MLIEPNQVGKREMLSDVLTRLGAKKHPILSMMPKGEDLTNMYFEWPVDKFEDPEDLAVLGGADVDTIGFDNPAPDTALLGMYAMKIMDSAMVDSLADKVSDVAGKSRGELADAILKKLQKLGDTIECFIAGDQECAAESGVTPYKGRGLGKWIQATAQATLPVGSNYLTPSASLDNTAMASFTPTIVNDVLQSSYTQTGQENTFTLVAGPTLRRRFSTFTELTTNDTAVYSTIRTYNTEMAGKIDNVVSVFHGDFGTINIVPSLLNAHASFGGSAAANLRRGYLLLPEMLSLHYKQKPRVKELEDRGGGPRFLADAIVGWKVWNPLPLGKFYATT